MVDTNDQWILQRTGIRERHIIDRPQTIVDLGTQAMKQALDNARMKPTDLDLVLCATITPQMICPSTAAQVVHHLGAVPAGAVDLNAACSGFVCAMNMAEALITSGRYKTIGIMGAEVLSEITDYSDRRLCILFGDGAGAAILTASDDPEQGCLYQSMASDGSMWPELYCPRSKQDLPADDKIFSGNYNTLQMNGQAIFKFAVSTLQKTIDETLAATGYQPSDLAVIVPHQSNKRILESARDRLKLSEDKMYINIDRFGNTSAASVPICLHELNEAGRIKPGSLVLFVALGGGLTWASSLWRI